MTTSKQSRRAKKQDIDDAQPSSMLLLGLCGGGLIVVLSMIAVFGGLVPGLAFASSTQASSQDQVALARPAGDDQRPELAAASAVATPEPSATAVLTNTPEPTKTPAPTSTPEPTATPEPSATPEPTPRPLPSLPPPVLLEGEGTTLTGPITFPSPINLAVISYEGGDAFGVSWIEPDGAQEVLTSGGGPYEGQHLVSGYGEHAFNITATGRWSIRIEPLAHCEDPEALASPAP